MYETRLDQTIPIRHRSKSGVGAHIEFGAPKNESVLGDLTQTCPQRMIWVQMAFVFVLLFSSLVLLQGLARAQGTLKGDNQACSVDQPCFNGAYQDGNTVVFQFTATGPWDFYNVRYAQAGGGEKQLENRSGHFTFTNVKPNSVYTISVQGCNSHTLAHSTCTAWSQASVTTAPEEKTGSVSTPLGRQTPPSSRPPVDPPKVVGRVNVGPSAPSQYSYSGWPPICNSALSARARNSPAAPTLEAQCRAQGGDPSRPPVDPPKVVGRVNGGPLTPSQLELEDKGSLIVSADMLLTAMRDLEPEGPRRDGFEIGVAIAADQTLWGPGKQAMIDSLPESEKNSAERSAHFVVTRNANAKFDSDGVGIAERETRAEVIAARSAEPAGYYTLGFDIGAGIFAGVARGGSGHTLPGPGSASIRNSLPPPGVRGFDAAMKLYMDK
jgi:Fibronectin type III domain